MSAGEQLAEAFIKFLSFFTPMFVVMIVVEWAVGFFRKDQ